MPLTEQDVRALTYLALRVRTDTHGAGPWDEHGVYANVIKLAGRNLAMTIEHVVRHAADPKAKNPGVLLGSFTPAAAEPERFRPPKANEACAVCGGWCPGPCARDRFVADGEQATPPRRAPGIPAPDGFKAARTALHETTEAS